MHNFRPHIHILQYCIHKNCAVHTVYISLKNKMMWCKFKMASVSKIRCFFYFHFNNRFLLKMDIFDEGGRSVCSHWRDYHWISCLLSSLDVTYCGRKKTVWFYQVLKLDIVHPNPGWVPSGQIGNRFELWCSKVGHWWSRWRGAFNVVVKRECINCE